MLEKDKGNIEDIVCQVKCKKKVERECDFAYLSIRGFDIEEFLDSLPINNHLSDILVLVLNGQVQWQFSTVILDITIASPHEQFLHYAPIARHYCQMQGRHPIREVLLIDLSPPGKQGVGRVFLTRIAGPMQGSTSLAILSADLHSFVEEVILRQGIGTMRTGESPCAAI